MPVPRWVALVVVPLLLALPAIAKRPKPEPCAPGRFLVAAASSPLLAGQSAGREAVAYDGAHVVSLDACGNAAPGTVKATRKTTVVRGRWATCGTFAKVAVTARIAAPACDVLSGRLKAKKTKVKKFTATRSTCGDGVVDGGGGESCDVSAPDGDATCPGACSACVCPSGSSSTTTTTLPGSCPAAPGYGGGTSLSVTSASATVTSPLGAQLAAIPAQIVGINLASEVDLTSINGSVTVNGPPATLQRPVFRYGDARTYVELAVPLTAATTNLGVLVTDALPSSGAPLTAGTTATVGTLALTPPAGATIAIDTLTYPTADDQQLRAVALPAAQQSAVIAPSGVDLEILFGTAPAGTLFCPSAAVTVPNTAGWPANAAVEFYVQGTDVGQDWAPFGGWGKVSDGHVSSDATSVSTNPGQGFPILTALFGIRLAPL